MSEIMKKTPFANVEVVNELNDDGYFAIIQNGETYKIPKQKIYDEINGEANTSITKIYIENGHLYFVMADGTEYDAGIVDVSSTKKYGICIDCNTGSPKVTRIGNAQYFVAEAVTGNEIKRNDFDNVFPFCDMKRCTLALDGTVTSYKGDPNYTEDGSIGEVMVEIPKYYRQVYYSESTGKEYRWYSKEKLNDYYKVPKRFVDKNGNEIDKIYIAAFLMSTNEDRTEGYSRSGKYYYETNKYSAMQNIGKSKGINWHIMDIWDYEVIKDLWMLEWATIDSQSIYYGSSSLKSFNSNVYADEISYNGEYEEGYTVIGNSFITNNNAAFTVGDEITFEAVTNETPGEFDIDTSIVRKITEIIPFKDESLQGFSLYVFEGSDVEMLPEFIVYTNLGRCGITNEITSSSGQINGEEGCQPFVWRGIENLYGEVYTWIDGIILNNNKYYVQHNPSLYDTDIFRYETDENDENNEIEILSYSPLSYEQPSTSGYISKMKYDENTGLTMPVEANGSSNIGYCDYFNKPRNLTSNFSCRFGGSSGLQGGLFNLYCNSNTTTANQSAARLSYSHYERGGSGETSPDSFK